MARTTLGPKKFKRGELVGGEFEVIKKLGTGGAGSVYRCRSIKKTGRAAGQEVALKLLENAADTQRFLREARVLRKTRHPNVVRLLGSGYDEKQPFLVLEFMDGGSVRDLLDKKGKIPSKEAAWILVQAIRGLRASKAVHRDLKPENLLISRGSKGRGVTLMAGDMEQGAQIKVADFGLAKRTDSDSMRLTNTGQVMGTPVYMSPEQCRNMKKVGPKTDIYALGVIFYEMVTGKVPFDAGNVYDIMHMHCNQEPTFPRMEKEVKRICEKCLQKSPSKRYGSLYQLEKDLAEVAGIRGVQKDSGGIAKVAIILLLLLIAAGCGWIFRDDLQAAWQKISGAAQDAVGEETDATPDDEADAAAD